LTVAPSFGASNNIVQKGLACGRHWSGTGFKSGRLSRSEILPRRLDSRGGASVVRRDAAMNRMEDLYVKISHEATSRAVGNACSY